MFTVLLVIHVLVTLALIGVVLIQRSEGGGLGIGGAQGMGSFMTGRGTANLLTRTTAILATVFLALSLVLALMTRNRHQRRHLHLQRPAALGRARLNRPRLDRASRPLRAHLHARSRDARDSRRPGQTRAALRPRHALSFSHSSAAIPKSAPGCGSVERISESKAALINI